MNNNKKGQIPNSYIQSVIQIPNNVYGYLDWTTGLIRVNVTFEEYQNLERKSQWFQDYFFETLAHELFHSFQICSCGYLYNYVTSLAHDLWVYDFDLDDEEKLISDLIYEEAKVSKIIIEKIKALSINGKYGFSILDIIEGQAFFVHNLTINPNLSPLAFRRKLNKYKGSCYEKTFGLLEDSIGEKCFYAFSAISYFALCFLDPCKVFTFLSEKLKSRKAEISFSTIYDLINSLIDDKFENQFIGSPFKHLTNHPETPLQPFYADTIKKWLSFFSIRELEQFMIVPNTFANRTPYDCLRPIIFNSTEILMPINYNPAPFDEVEDFEDMIRAVSSLSFKMLNNHGKGVNYFNISH